MNEEEKNIARRLSEKITELESNEQHYILGMAEGMAIAKDGQRDKQLQEA